jgi:phosphatidylglycerophosphatase A
LKPWPVNWLDRNLQGGFGIMVDDVAAGIYSLVCLQLAYYGSTVLAVSL